MPYIGDTISVPWRLRRVLVAGPSMVPTLRDGDRAWAVLGGRRTPAPGSVVVVRLPDDVLAVKRLTRVEPDGRVWVEGDNPYGSTDSRTLGALPPDAIVGRLLRRRSPPVV